MTFVLINSAPDGVHESVHKTLDAAGAALAKHLGRPIEARHVRLGEAYYSDWGNRLVIEARPAGHTARIERQLRAAFDARECGTATEAQLALLDKRGL